MAGDPDSAASPDTGPSPVDRGTSVAQRRRPAYFGRTSEPCCITEPQLNHRLLRREKLLVSVVWSAWQTCGKVHSNGLNLQQRRRCADQ